MSINARVGNPSTQFKDFSPIPREFELFARIEGLVGEEAALLAVPHDERDGKHRERLRMVSAELDRIWGRLKERAERLGRDHDHAG